MNVNTQHHSRNRDESSTAAPASADDLEITVKFEETLYKIDVKTGASLLDVQAALQQKFQKDFRCSSIAVRDTENTSSAGLFHLGHTLSEIDVNAENAKLKVIVFQWHGEAFPNYGW